MRIKKSLKELKGLCIPCTGIALWQLLACFEVFHPTILPSPLAVFSRWWLYLKPLDPFDPQKMNFLIWIVSGELPQDAFSSLYRVGMGFFIGTTIALPLGLFMGYNSVVHALFNPLIQLLRPIPPIAYIPLAILWFGLGNPPAIFLISIGAFFPVLINTIAGVHSVDGIYIRAARNLGANKLTIFIRVIIPCSAPYILSGLRIGMGTSFIVVIVSEMIAVTNGLGFRILEAREYMWSDKIIAGMITIGLLGLCIDTLMRVFAKNILLWHRELDI